MEATQGVTATAIFTMERNRISRTVNTFKSPSSHRDGGSISWDKAIV